MSTRQRAREGNQRWRCLLDHVRTGDSSRRADTLACLLRSLFSVLLAYFVVGMTYNGLVKRQSGINLLPHAQFWISLPVHAIVSDGALQHSSVGYRDVLFRCRKAAERRLASARDRRRPVEQRTNLFSSNCVVTFSRCVCTARLFFFFYKTRMTPMGEKARDLHFAKILSREREASHRPSNEQVRELIDHLETMLSLGCSVIFRVLFTLLFTRCVLRCGYLLFHRDFVNGRKRDVSRSVCSH